MIKTNLLEPSNPKTFVKIKELKDFAESLESSSKMPLLFVGHGNPMNAVADNEFTKGWENAGKSLMKPNAILCISAHWETQGTFVTAMDMPITIHDFYGFPEPLYQVSYPAPGSPDLAKNIKEMIKKTPVEFDQLWGLDHGCWSVIKHMFPKADIPIIEMSLDYSKPAIWHYELAREISSLRKRGVLIVGSGNIVHNLRMMDWQNDKGFDWARKANETMKNLALGEEHRKLIEYGDLGKEVRLAVPTPEHYLPLLYILGLKEKKDSITFFNDKTVLGSVSMTSMILDKA